MQFKEFFSQTIGSYIHKIFTVKGGRVTILSAIISLIPTIYIMANFHGVDTFLTEGEKSSNNINLALNILLTDVNLKYIFLPLLFEIIAFFIFSTLTLINLISGLQASRILYERQHNKVTIKVSDWLDKDRLWNTFWKYSSTLFVTTLIIGLCICCEIGKYDWGYGISLWFLFLLWILACGFEFISIGDNIEIKTGRKPRIFTLYDALINKLSTKTIDKIDVLNSNQN